MPTAGAHQPTFYSLRGTAKALLQGAPKARVESATSPNIICVSKLSIVKCLKIVEGIVLILYNLLTEDYCAIYFPIWSILGCLKLWQNLLGCRVFGYRDFEKVLAYIILGYRDFQKMVS